MNKKIIIAAFVITGAGVINAFTNKKPVTPVIIGSYIFVLMLALADMFGGPLSEISGALAMLAVVYVLLTEVPWQTFIRVAQGK